MGADKNEYFRARRERLIEEGICVSCARAPARPGRRMCPSCAELASRRVREQHRYYKNNGICVKCGSSVAASGRTLCLDCADKNNIDRMSRYDARKAYGTCARCGRPASDRHTLCQDCRAKLAEAVRRMRKWRSDAGLCTRCGQVRVSGMPYRRCPKCREKARMAQMRHAERKLGIWKEMD